MWHFLLGHEARGGGIVSEPLCSYQSGPADLETGGGWHGLVTPSVGGILRVGDTLVVSDTSS